MILEVLDGPIGRFVSVKPIYFAGDVLIKGVLLSLVISHSSYGDTDS